MKPRMLAVKPSELVILAIHNLEEKEGSYPQDIVKFISTQYGIESEQVKKHVEEALQRGLQFGILAENQGRYMLEEVPQPPQENESIPNQEPVENKTTNDNVRKRRSLRKRSPAKRKSSEILVTESLELLEKRQKSNASKAKKNNKRKTKGSQGEGSKTRRRSARQR